jgi:hypothetical protein
MVALFFKKKLRFFTLRRFFRTQACDFVGELRAKGIAGSELPRGAVNRRPTRRGLSRDNLDRRLGRGARPAAARRHGRRSESVFLDLIDRGFAGVRASMKGTAYA